MGQRTARLLATRIAVAAAVAILSACARQSVPDLLASARARLQAGQADAAIVELKNALQREPASASARLLLGQTLLAQGHASAALVELEKAAALGHPATLTWPPIARAMLALGQHRQVVERFEGTLLPTGPAGVGDGNAAADLQTSVAAAHAAQGQRDAAAAAVKQTLRLSPRYAPAVLLQARLLAVAGDVDEAQRRLQTLLDDEPQNAHAWQLSGDLLTHQGAPAADAALAYRRALVLRPNHAPAHAGLVSALLRSGDVAAARRQADAMRAALPIDPLTDFVDAQVAYVEGQLPKARTLSLTALRALPDQPRLQQFVGLTELRLGAPLEAEPPLLKSLQRAPEDALTRHLLAQVYLATGQPGKLEQVLEPLLRRADPEALQWLARARLQNGQPAAAQALLQRARAKMPDDAEVGRLRIEGLIAGRQFSAALAAVSGLDARQPDTAHLRGRLALARRDTTAARAAFEQALALLPTHEPSALALAALDTQAGQPALAVARLQAMLRSQPAAAAPTLALVAVLGNRGDHGAGHGTRERTLLADALHAHPGDPRLRLAYAGHLQREGDAAAAEQVLQEGVAAMNGNVELLDALARLQLGERQFGQALLTLNKQLPLRPRSIEPLLRMAEAQVGLGDTAQARQTYQRALLLRPGALPALRGLVGLALLERQPQAALAVARQVQQQRGALGTGLLLEGDVLFAGGNLVGAAAVYLDGLRRAPGTELAAKAHATLLAQGHAGAAATLAADWRRAHPRDAEFAVHLGNAALARGDAATAERDFRDAVALQPLHGLALNNLATAMLQLGHAGALPYAARAATLLPERAEVLDTLAAALWSERQPARALEVQRRAVALAPRNAALLPQLARLEQAVAVVKPVSLR